MATTTTNLGLTKPAVGADADAWGGQLNASLDVLDLSVQFGALTKSVAGAANVTLSANEAAKDIIILTGAITANIAVIFPDSPSRRYVVRNNTTGAFTVTLRRAVGTGVVLPQGATLIVVNDGSDVVFESVSNALSANTATTATTATTAGNGGVTSVSAGSGISVNQTTGAVTITNTSLGVGNGQTWQNLTASRASNTTYTNTTGRPILVLISYPNSNLTGTLTVDGQTLTNLGSVGTSGGGWGLSFVVTINGTYSLSHGNGAPSKWLELR